MHITLLKNHLKARRQYMTSCTHPVPDNIGSRGAYKKFGSMSTGMTSTQSRSIKSGRLDAAN